MEQVIQNLATVLGRMMIFIAPLKLCPNSNNYFYGNVIGTNIGSFIVINRPIATVSQCLAIIDRSERLRNARGRIRTVPLSHYVARHPQALFYFEIVWEEIRAHDDLDRNKTVIAIDVNQSESYSIFGCATTINLNAMDHAT